MSSLFNNQDSDSESEIKVDNEYAKNYNSWRKKEELNKLKTKYGEINASDPDNSSSSSEDDDECVDLTSKLEQNFFKTLASLKNKDPKIYDESVKFFDDTPIETGVRKKKAKDGPMYINDYERKLLLETGGDLSDQGEEDDSRPRSPTYVEEQKELRENLKSALTKVEEDDTEGWGGLFKTRQKTNEDKDNEDADYKQWLLGQKQNLEDESAETQLQPLRDYWSDPKLESGEKFLRDYILNKRFLEKGDHSYVPTYEEVVHDSDEGLSEDEEALDKQEEFEHKYNYRFEEPDQDFIKRYPRTMENSLRKKDDKRKVKRIEVKERKQKEKQQKMDDLKQLRDLKRQEIEEKLKKLREITGNTEVGFEDQDLDDDFDPDAHDKRMRALFSDEFYEGEEGDQKPEFPDLDEELEIERWDKYVKDGTETNEENVPHCEDDNFNMDCDYDPASTQKELIENSKGKKKRKRKSKFAVAVSGPKPIFDPNDKTYEEYLDEYYKLDCEDIIGDIPCRFKYRKVIPNNFGLTVDEILKANDRELNRWCSIKKATQHRPDHVEKYDQIAFNKKAQNESLKRKILPSLYAEETNVSKRNEDAAEGTSELALVPAETVVGTINPEAIEETAIVKPKKQKKNKKLNKKASADVCLDTNTVETKSNETLQIVGNKANTEAVSDLKSGGLVNSKIENSVGNKLKSNEPVSDLKSGGLVNKKIENSVGNKLKSKERAGKKNKKRKMVDALKSSKKPKSEGNSADLTDARLQAFGIKPKKFKNKMKYGKSNNSV